MSAEFLLTSLILVLLPGTGVIYTLTSGLSQGWKAGIWAALGCTFGIVPAVVASVTGLAALLHASALVFEALRYIGVAYLLYMAIAIWRDHSMMVVDENQAQKSNVKVAINGCLINILNPKLTIFFLAFLPQFVPANATNGTERMILLGAVFMAMTFVIFAGYGLFASLARRYVLTRPRVMLWLRRSIAGVFVMLGARLAFSSR
ncbi:LysE family translocator [Thalassospira marina]|uniref:Lysine transporter LysE n=1 Tax=Thalassospira marina TaxID=2048283 RepID=A0ABN5FDZ2_9PROT|nr:LysE family translocator [Thalassospira marina]AUG53188.1 lysine transporter LysE [Thalassospira marina]